MALPTIRLGDPASDCGKAITAAATHSISGIGIARLGDSISCSLPGHGANTIVEIAGDRMPCRGIAALADAR